MSDQCVRGCLRPCHCEECRDSDKPEHEPQPAPAEEGYLCKRCANRLHKWLETVLDDTMRLDARIATDYGWDKEGGHQKVSGSPALVRLEVAALTDGRSTSVVSENAEGYPENSEEQAIIAIPDRVCSWALLVAEELELASPVQFMAQAVAVLEAFWSRIVDMPWVDDFYNDMAQIRTLLDLAHGVERPKPMGNCFTCDKALYHRAGHTDIRCGRCGRRYDGLSIVKLEIQRRREVT